MHAYKILRNFECFQNKDTSNTKDMIKNLTRFKDINLFEYKICNTASSICETAMNGTQSF